MKVETADNGPDRVTGACWRWWCLWWCLLVVVVCLSGDYKRRVVCHRVMHFSRRVWGKGGGGVALIVWMWVIGCAGICLLLPSFLAASSFRGHPLRQTAPLPRESLSYWLPSQTKCYCVSQPPALFVRGKPRWLGTHSAFELGVCWDYRAPVQHEGERLDLSVDLSRRVNWKLGLVYVVGLYSLRLGRVRCRCVYCVTLAPGRTKRELVW